MAEALGVATSATQLASLCLNLLGLITKIKGATPTLQSYNHQLQELSFLSDAISQNPLLQTSEIELHTRSLLSLIQKTELSSLLTKHRFVRAWLFIQKEQYLADTLTAVDRQKINLCLSIEHIQAKALHRIQTDISNMAQNTTPGTDSQSKSLNRHRVWEEIEKMQRDLPIDRQELLAASTSTAVVKFLQSQQDSREPEQEQGQGKDKKNKPQEKRSFGFTVGATAGPGVSQQNGCILNTSAKDLENTEFNHTFIDCVKIGDKFQHNGSTINTVGEPAPGTDYGKWMGNHVRPQMWTAKREDVEKSEINADRAKEGDSSQLNGTIINSLGAFPMMEAGQAMSVEMLNAYFKQAQRHLHK